MPHAARQLLTVSQNAYRFSGLGAIYELNLLPDLGGGGVAPAVGASKIAKDGPKKASESPR